MATKEKKKKQHLESIKQRNLYASQRAETGVKCCCVMRWGFTSAVWRSDRSSFNRFMSSFRMCLGDCPTSCLTYGTHVQNLLGEIQPQPSRRDGRAERTCTARFQSLSSHRMIGSRIEPQRTEAGASFRRLAMLVVWSGMKAIKSSEDFLFSEWKADRMGSWQMGKKKKISSPLTDLRSCVVYCGKSDESNWPGTSLQTSSVSFILWNIWTSPSKNHFMVELVESDSRGSRVSTAET